MLIWPTQRVAAPLSSLFSCWYISAVQHLTASAGVGRQRQSIQLGEKKKKQSCYSCMYKNCCYALKWWTYCAQFFFNCQCLCLIAAVATSLQHHTINWAYLMKHHLTKKMRVKLNWLNSCWGWVIMNYQSRRIHYLRDILQYPRDV